MIKKYENGDLIIEHESGAKQVRTVEELQAQAAAIDDTIEKLINKKAIINTDIANANNSVEV